MLAALAGAAPASAEKVLKLGKDGRVRERQDRWLPATEMPEPPRQRRSSGSSRGGARAAAHAARRHRARRQRRKKRTVVGELRKLQRSGALPGEDFASRVSTWRHIRKRGRRMDGTRGREMRAVIATVRDIARRGQLTPSRVIPLWLTLERNYEWWREGSIPSSGERLEFAGSELVWQYYPGQGIQLQMLGNFGKLNGLWGARRDTRAGQLADQLVSLAVERAGGVAWEYYFEFNGGRAPWVSGMAQGTAVQALARTARRLDREEELLPLLQRALAIFEAPTPQGVRVPGDRGDHYALYSFAPDFRVINGFTQALVGLYDYARISGDPRGQQLFAAGDREAQYELPRFDTGAWSLYSRGSLKRESDLSYHDLLLGFVENLCERTEAEVYCTTAEHFADYKTIPPEIEVLSRRVRGGGDRRVKFRLSKISDVTLRITRGEKVVQARSFGRVGYGRRSFAWYDVPRRRGRYTVTLSATDLAGNSAQTAGTVRVLKPKRRKRT